MWEAICKVIGREQWLTDPRYATPKGRLPHLMEIFDEIEEWTKTKDKFEAITDFADKDKIVFDGVSGVDDFSDLTLTRVGSSTVITWGTSDSLTVDGVRPNQLHASDFDFGSGAAAAFSFVTAGDLQNDGAWVQGAGTVHDHLF